MVEDCKQFQLKNIYQQDPAGCKTWSVLITSHLIFFHLQLTFFCPASLSSISTPWSFQQSHGISKGTHTANTFTLDFSIQGDLGLPIWGNCGLRKSSKGSFGPDWSLRSICWVIFTSELPSKLTWDAGIQGKYADSATICFKWYWLAQISQQYLLSEAETPSGFWYYLPSPTISSGVEK